MLLSLLYSFCFLYSHHEKHANLILKISMFFSPIKCFSDKIHIIGINKRVLRSLLYARLLSTIPLLLTPER